MKWLIAFPIDGETDAAIKYACEQNGIEWGEVDAKKYPWTLYSEMCRDKYDFVLMSRTSELYPDFMRAKHRFSDTPFGVWNVDTRKDIAEWGTLLRMFELVDVYFVMSKSDEQEFRALNKNTYYLPQGLQEERYHPVEVSEEEKIKYTCDISFIGPIETGIHMMRPAVINALKEYFPENGIYGFKHFNGIYGEEHSKVVQCSRINISCAHSPEKIKYFSVRNYKIMGCGGVLMDLHHPGLEELFPGAVFYTSPADCVGKARDILANYDEYKKKAVEGTHEVLENHTYTERIKSVKDYLETEKMKEY